MPVYRITGPDGKTLDITGDAPPSADVVRAAFAHAGAAAPGSTTKPGIGEQLFRGTTATLPVMGGVLGGVAGAPVGGVGAIAGMAGGTTLGESLRQLANQYMYGDKQDPVGALNAGALAGAGETGLQGLSRLAANPGVRAAAGTLAEDVPVLRKFKPAYRAYKAYQGATTAAPEAVGPPPVLRKGTGAPSLTDTLHEAINEARAPNPATNGTTPPPVTQTPAGKPSVTAAQADQLASGASAQPAPKAPPAQGASSMGNGPASAPAQTAADRVQEGAERIGKKLGQTKEQVRQATGPIVGEKAGEASPILPQRVLNDIIDKIKALPPGSARADYAARANDPKTRAQVENVIRTLTRLGLSVGAATQVANTVTNGGPSKSPADIARLLEQHGFRTN